MKLLISEYEKTQKARNKRVILGGLSFGTPKSDSYDVNKFIGALVPHHPMSPF